MALLVEQRGLHSTADAAYVEGYWAALRTVATSLGLGSNVFVDANKGNYEIRKIITIHEGGENGTF